MPAAQRVFAFEDPVDFLRFELQERQKQDPRFSLRAWARQVGYENPSYLSHVLNRKRRLKMELAARLAADLRLEGKALRYFELIVLGHGGATDSERAIYRRMLKSLRPKRGGAPQQLSLDSFAVVSDWYHLAILEMTQLAGAEITERFVQSRLFVPLARTTVRNAIDRLVRVGLLVRAPDGRVLRRRGANLVDPHVPSEAVKAYHQQMGDIALKALRSQAAEERDFRGSTLAFSRRNLERAREVLREAHRQIVALADEGEGEEVYQLNTQFFRVTKRSKSRRV